MKSPRQVLGQILGRGGRPAIVDMTVEQVRAIAPGFCERLKGAGVSTAACRPYLHRTVGELAQAEHLTAHTLLAAAQEARTESRPHMTGGHRPWPGPRLTAPVAELDLERELERLHAEPAWQEFGRNAKTLVKSSELRIVLMTLKTGARLEQHAAPGAISIQVLSGRVRVSLPSEEVDLMAGEMVAVGPAIRHELEALEGSAVLLTIAEPPRQHAALPVSQPPAPSHWEAAVRRAAIERRSPDEQAMLTEGQMRPDFDTVVRGGCFAPIEGYTIVKSGATSVRHHGFYVVDEPFKGIKATRQYEDYAASAESRVGASIPGDVVPGERPLDLASTSLVPPSPAELGIHSSVDASYPDLRHLARGGPHVASQ